MSAVPFLLGIVRMKAVVAVPSIRDFYHTPHRFSSLGAIAVKNALEKYGVDVVFMNFPAMMRKPRTLELPRELDYLQPYLIQGERGRVSFFHKFRHFGPDFESCADRIIRENPDICFLSCFAYCYSPQLIDLTQTIREKGGKFPVIAGGAGVSVASKEIILHSCLDAVIIREADTVIPKYLHALQNGFSLHTVPNIVWKKNGNVVASDILDTPESIPLLWANSSPKKGKRLVSTSLTRGCPRSCRYCPISLIHGKRFRKTDEHLVANTIESELFSSYLPLHVIFEDDNLLLDFDYFMRIVSRFRNHFKEFTFSAENGMDYLLLDENKVQQLVTAGITQFNLSIMSTSTPVLNAQSRHNDIDHYRKIAACIAGHQIPCITYFICGCQGDTVETIADNLVFLSEQPATLGISMFYGVPGLPDMSGKPILSPYHCLGSAAYPWFIDTSTLVTAFRLSRLINLIKSSNQSQQEINLIQICLKTGQIHTIVRQDRKDHIVPVEHTNPELAEKVLSRLNFFQAV